MLPPLRPKVESWVQGGPNISALVSRSKGLHIPKLLKAGFRLTLELLKRRSDDAVHQHPKSVGSHSGKSRNNISETNSSFDLCAVANEHEVVAAGFFGKNTHNTCCQEASPGAGTML